MIDNDRRPVMDGIVPFAKLRKKADASGAASGLTAGSAAGASVFGVGTEQTFASRTTSGAGTAGCKMIRSVRGNTLLFNQLLGNGDFSAGTEGWSGTRCSLSPRDGGGLDAVITDASGAVTISVDTTNRFPVYVGRKYYVYIRSTNPRTYTGKVHLSASTAANAVSVAWTAGVENVLSTVITADTDVTSAICFAIRAGTTDTFQVGDVFVLSCAMVVDLTAMYGTGNEPTAEEFRAAFPAEYYDQTAAAPLHYNGTGLRTSGTGWAQELPLPVGTYFPGGMKSAGTVYDELLPDKAVQRIGERPYEAGDENDSTVLTDGTVTFYALDDAVETAISPALNMIYKAENGGTETSLPVNGAPPVTSPFRGVVAAGSALGAVGLAGVPASASAAGSVGSIAVDSGYLYVCVSEGTWKRVALSTF